MVPGRWLMMLVITPLGVLFFGGGGALVIGGDYGFADRSVQAGIATGLAVNVLLGAVGLLRGPLTAEELRRSRATYRRVTAGRAILAFAGIGTVLAAIVTGSALAPFGLSFCFALMAGASLLAGVLAASGRGLHQRDEAASHEVRTWRYGPAASRSPAVLPPEGDRRHGPPSGTDADG